MFDTNEALQPQKMARFRKQRDCTIYGGKTKALISCATAQLVWGFFFAYIKSRFSHDAAHCTVCVSFFVGYTLS